MKTRSPLSLWIIAGLLTPLVIIGGLLGALSSGENALERVPVALVNNDELITETDDAGEETFIFASKPLVTELVTSDDFAVDWLVTSSEQARALLASGDVYAIVEIPEDFSYAVTTLETDNPEQATFTIITDASHSYLAGLLSDQIGDALASGVSDEFGSGIMEGLFTAIVEIADGFDEIAEGADTLADGVEEVSEGVTELNDGVEDLASGYTEFDDGLGTFSEGVTSLSDGLDALGEGTSGLTALSTGVKTYTDSISTLSAGLSGVKASGALSGNPAEASLNALIDGLATAASGGGTLSTQTSTALSGVTKGIIELDKGADALDDAGQDIAEGSGEIREGLTDLAEGTGELDEGMVELADGAREFADGVAEGAADLREGAGTMPSDEALEVLNNPVVFDGSNISETIGFQETLSSVLVPVGMWLVALAYFLALPSYSSRILGSTARTQALLGRATRPILVMVGTWSAIVITLLHTLGGVAWSALGFTGPIVVLSALAMAAVHFAVWAWNPRWLAPLSLGALIVQIVSLGSVVPIEILPSIYQAISGATPLGWTTDALIASLAGGDISRTISALVSLAVLTTVAYILSALILRSKRTLATQTQVGLQA
ncbi:MAG: ABC transporter permease [Actinomycetota bacterium]|nr:ABC transporter permease [Actinomycetota bacterium]MDA2980267.1 ABC transporter permease [Actinomycetota bacterium]